MSPRRRKQIPLGADDEEDDSERLSVFDAALIWASNGKDEVSGAKSCAARLSKAKLHPIRD